MFMLHHRAESASVAVNASALAVSCRALTKRFGAATAVRDVSFDVPRGTLMALLGPSGGGKTTALRMIAGFEAPDAGTIEIDGTLVAGAGALVPPERRRVGMVFQDYALFPHLSVRGNVAFGLNKGTDRDRRVADVLDMVGLDGIGERMPNELSGGQQQRVALARALAPQPAVVLLDEPFSNLDASLRGRVRAEVQQILSDAETAAIFVTHDQDEAFGLADHVGIMLDSTIVQTGTAEQVYLNPASLSVAMFLGEENILDGIADGGYVTSELGRLPLSDPDTAPGPVKIAVRPESVRLHPDSGTSVSAEVVGLEFRGIYKLVRVRLPSGITLSAVMGVHIPAPVGETVQVAVNAPVSAFPT